jgi:hypothetical protein
VLAIALFEAGQLEVVGKEGAAGHFTSGWRPQPGGPRGQKDCEKSLIARSPGLREVLDSKAGSPRDCVAASTKTDAIEADGEADEADVDADLLGLNCFRLRAGVPRRTSRLRPQ